MNNPGAAASNDYHNSTAAGTSDPKIFVATTLAALALAGSAYIWKSGTFPMRKARMLSGGSASGKAVPVATDDGTDVDVAGPHKEATRRDGNPQNRRDTLESIDSQDASSKRRGSQATSERDPTETIEPQNDAGGCTTERQHQQEPSGSAPIPTRSSRAKERRRRGKDPTKELLKSGKLNKVLNANTSKDSVPTNRDVSPSSTRSGLSSSSYSQSITPRPQEYSSNPPSTTAPPPDYPSFSDSHSLYRTRSRSSAGPSCDTHFPTESIASSVVSLDAPSSTSSASSSIAATETTLSSIASTSTAPSSIMSATSQSQEDSDLPPRLNESDGTPKPGLNNPGARAAMPTSPTNRQQDSHPSPWEWDGATTDELNSQLKVSPARGDVSGSTKQASGPSSEATSSEVLSVSASLPYASVVSTSRSGASVASAKPATPTTGYTTTKSGKTRRPSLDSDSERAQSPLSLASYVHYGRLDEEDEDELLDEVPADEISFPSLNNHPEANSSSTSGSPWSTGTPNSNGSSVSRPQSRASNSSAASSRGKGKHSRGISGLAPLSRVPSNPIPPANAANSAPGQRRAPTPNSTGRPATPSSTTSGGPPQSPSAVYYAPGFAGASATASNVSVSAQTQLASLRGALEAARLREEKSKHELEKATREGDALRWENAAWRRREGELQSQIHQMMHQMQVYSTYIASMNARAAHGHAPSQDAQALAAFTMPALPVPEPPHVSVEESENADDTKQALDAPKDPSVDENAVAAEPETTTSTDTAEAPSPPARETSPSVLHSTPRTVLPFAPQPHPLSPIGSSFPHHAMHPSASYMHQHLPLVSSPQTPAGMPPFVFPHLSTVGPQAHTHGPPSPFTVVPMNVNAQGVRSPVGVHPPGYPMHGHHHASPSTPSYVPVAVGGAGSGMMGSHPHAHHAHTPSGHASPSPLWMPNGGSAAPSAAVAMKLGGGPSSPLPAYLERGRKDRGAGKGGKRKKNTDGGGSAGASSPREGEEASSEGSGSAGSPGPDSDGVPDRHSSEGEGSDDEDINILLADAILKRPGSIGMGSGSSRRSNSSNHGGGGRLTPGGGGGSGGGAPIVASTSVNGVWPGVGGCGGPLVNGAGSAQTSPTQEVVEEFEEQHEFTFPSLSELGNVAREKRVGTPALDRTAAAAVNGEAGNVASWVLNTGNQGEGGSSINTVAASSLSSASLEERNQ